MWDWERWAYVHHHSRSLILSSRVLHLCFSRQGIRLIKRMCPAADNMHIQGVFKCTQAEMTPLASYSEACLKESCGRVSVYVVPPSWDDKYHANPIRSAKCSVCSVTKLFFFLYQASIWHYLQEFVFVLPASGVDQKSKQTSGGRRIMESYGGKASHPRGGGLMHCRLSRRCWTTPHVSMAAVPTANINYFHMTWILWPFKKPFKLDA